MTKDYTTRCEMEAKTYELLDTHVVQAADWSPSQAVVANVFRACWSSALPADRVTEIGNALTGGRYQVDTIQNALTKLVRKKALRSYNKGGKRYYEVNY